MSGWSWPLDCSVWTHSQFQDAISKVETVTPAFYYHVKMKDGGRLDIDTDPSHNAFIYMIKGEAELEGGKKLKANQLALYERGENQVRLFSDCENELLVLGGQPLNEPVISYGPFVMNTEEQIRQCMRNYQNGLMGNPDSVNWLYF